MKTLFALLLISFFIQNIDFYQANSLNILFLSLISIVFLLRNYKKIKIPKYPTIFFASYLLFTLISFWVNQNSMFIWNYRSYSDILLRFSFGLFFIISYSFQKQVSHYLIKYIYLISIVSIIWYLVSINTHYLFVYRNYFQMYYPMNLNHNHLGDLLILPLLVEIYKLNKYILINGINIFVFYFFTVLSCSRSAYLSLFSGLFVLNFIFKLTKLQKILICSMLIFTIVFSILISRDGNYPITDIYKSANKIIIKKLSINPKKLFGDRDIYVREAIYGISKKPLFGYGINNFGKISFEYVTKDDKPNQVKKHLNIVTTSHDILLDIFAESGVFAFGFFCLFIVSIMIKSKKNIYFIMVLAMIINFLCDYSFQIAPFVVIFYLLLGLIYEERMSIGN